MSNIYYTIKVFYWNYQIFVQWFSTTAIFIDLILGEFFVNTDHVEFTILMYLDFKLEIKFLFPFCQNTS